MKERRGGDVFAGLPLTAYLFQCKGGESVAKKRKNP